LYDFWFYITNFSRYPMEIYSGDYPGAGKPHWGGQVLWGVFTFLIPILLVINVPANVLAKGFSNASEATRLPLYAAISVAAAIASLAASRWVFQRALLSYRSASS
ncbi:MAG: ABC-2 family transporter protein, partial [Planctomycetota bacterium]